MKIVGRKRKKLGVKFLPNRGTETGFIKIPKIAYSLGVNAAGRRMFSVDIDETLQTPQARLGVLALSSASIAGTFSDSVSELTTLLGVFTAFLLACAQIYTGIRKSKRADKRQEVLLAAVRRHLERTRQDRGTGELDAPTCQRIERAILDTEAGIRPLASIQELKTALDELERLDS